MSGTRVLWLTKGLGRGGAEQLLASTARHIDRQRFAIEVAYLLPWKDALVAECQASDVPVFCLGQRRAADPRWAWRLRRLVAERGYDIVHSHMPLPAVVARLALARPRPRLVHTEHNTWSRYRWSTGAANALTYSRNDRVIAVSHAVSASIDPRRVWGRLPEVQVLHHGIELSGALPGSEHRGRARELLGIPPDAPVVGTVGTLTAKKDHRSLVEAFAIVRDALPDSRLVIVGGGPLERALRHQVAVLGLEGVVCLTGTRNDVPSLLPAFDVFAMSSLFEGLSIALIEGMAAGLPAVVTKVGGMPEVVVDGVTGRLVTSRDPRAMSEALVELLRDGELHRRMSAASYRRAQEFDLRAAVRKIEKIYDQVVAAR
ncbi:MAG: glycosyltransferase [Nocardioidaceae bacterium]